MPASLEEDNVRVARFDPGVDEKPRFASSSSLDGDAPGSKRLHIVPRNDAPANYATAQNEDIVGYDADLMRDRTLLSNVEEKKLIRRIDWHLIPLLSVMYAVKTIDAANVLTIPTTFSWSVADTSSDLKCTNHGPRNSQEYHN